jgi:glycosyltransferase involved in cell wall biosynthesis
MSAAPRISVIINSYNSARYIAAAIDSVLAQTLAPCELLVMDDGSTDETEAVARGYGPALAWAQQAHSGVAAARNASLERVRGDLIAFLDADDMWVPAKLAIQAAAFRAQPAPDAVFGHVRQLISPDLDPAVAASVWAPDYPVPGRIASTMLVTPQALARVGGFTTQLRITEFLDWYARALEAGLRMPMLPDLVAWRRIHGANQSLRDSADRLEYPRVLKAALERRRAAARQR